MVAELCKNCKHLEWTKPPFVVEVCLCNIVPANGIWCCPCYEVKPQQDSKIEDNKIKEKNYTFIFNLLLNGLRVNDLIAVKYHRVLTDMMTKYSIIGKYRVLSFLSTLEVESGGFRYTRELGKDEYFNKYEYYTKIGKQLGNLYRGDGLKFKGRGLIQITGRANYESVAVNLGIDCIANPELLEELPYSVESACWWWKEKKLNELADMMESDGYEVILPKIRKRVNGGLNGYERFKNNYLSLCKLWE